MVRQRTANPLFPGSNPGAASKIEKGVSLIADPFLVVPPIRATDPKFVLSLHYTRPNLPHLTGFHMTSAFPVTQRIQPISCATMVKRKKELS